MTDPRWPEAHMRARLARLEDTYNDSWPRWNLDDHSALRGILGKDGVDGSLVERIERILVDHGDTDMLPPSAHRRLAVAIAEAVQHG